MSDDPAITLPHGAKPSRALDTIGIRPALQHGHVVTEGDRRVLITTDSYILARHPVGDDVPLGPVHADALQYIEEHPGRHVVTDGAVTASHNGVETVWKPTCAPAFIEKPAPGFDQGDDKVVEVYFDAKLLARLANSLGNRKVKLEIRVQDDGAARPTAPMRVTPLDESGGGEGLIMPVRKS